MRLGIFLIITVIISDLKRNLKIIYENELRKEKERVIAKTMQEITGLIAQNITSQNSEVLK